MSARARTTCASLCKRHCGQDGLCWELKSKSLDQSWHAAGIHLYCIALAQAGEELWTRIDYTSRIAQFAEELLEASRRDDLQNSCRVVTSIPEGVPLIAGLEDQIARFANAHIITQQGAYLSLQHKAVFVFAGVTVKRRR